MRRAHVRAGKPAALIFRGLRQQCIGRIVTGTLLDYSGCVLAHLRSLRFAAASVVAVMLALSAAPAAQMLAERDCPMTAAPEHCAEVTSALEACCCDDATHSATVPAPVVKRHVTPTATAAGATVATLLRAATFSATPIAVAQVLRTRGRSLTVLYSTFLI
jgi:hypothetical protein